MAECILFNLLLITILLIFILTDIQIEVLKLIGVLLIKTGIENMSKNLRLVKRFQSNNRIIQNIKKIKSYNIKVSANIMIGLLEQKKIDILNTIKFTKSIGADVVTINIFDPPPSSEIYKLLHDYKLRILEVRSDYRKIIENQYLNRK
ncbi:MAG: hypothetical protein ACTSPY_06710 [Candidatus Helarchaeota archaeon]